MPPWAACHFPSPDTSMDLPIVGRSSALRPLRLGGDCAVNRTCEKGRGSHAPSSMRPLIQVKKGFLPGRRMRE